MSQSHEILLQRLMRLGKMSSEDVEAINSLPIEQAELKAEQSIARIYDRPSRSVLITSGLAAMFKDTLDGRRQIHSFHRAGDMPDLHSLHLTTLDASLATLTSCRVGFLRHDHLRRLCERHHRIAAALWRSTLIDASVHREWITNVGQRKALARMSHLFCEEFVRSDVAGLTDPGGRRVFSLPITQVHLGEALGLSNVHVNRTLKSFAKPIWSPSTADAWNC